MIEKLDAILLGLFLFIFGFTVGVNCAVDTERRKAIEAGAGRWEQVDDGPDTEFVYGAE